MGTGGEFLHLADGPQADELFPLRSGQPRTFGGRLADTVLARAHHPLHSDIEGSGAAVDLGMGDETLLYPQDIERLHSVGAPAQPLGAGDEITEQALPEARRN